MSKQQTSKLDPFAERLIAWFTPKDKGGDGLTLLQVQEQLKLDGVVVSLSRLSRWWEAQQSELNFERQLKLISTGASQCREVEKEFGQNPAPELETLIKLHRVVIMQQSAQATADPKMLEMVDRGLRTIMDFVSGQTKAALEQRKLSLQERRVVLLEKQLKDVKDVVASTLTPEQQRERLKEILK